MGRVAKTAVIVSKYVPVEFLPKPIISMIRDIGRYESRLLIYASAAGAVSLRARIFLSM